jgi:drug/metabolite transporter (DMT)-like permease
MSDSDTPRLGITLRVASGLLFAGMFVCAKQVSDDVPLGEIVFFRSAFAIIPLIIFLWLRSEFPQGLATKRPCAQVWGQWRCLPLLPQSPVSIWPRRF